MGSTTTDSTNHRSKILGKITPVLSYYSLNNRISIYILLGTISNPEMIERIRRMCKLCTNTMLFHVRELNICRFDIHGEEILKPVLHRYQRMTILILSLNDTY
jgi:hypothetical protein